MKIVHVVYSLEMGGAEVLVGQLARLERRNGHEVSICAYSQLGMVGEELQAEGFDIYVPGVAHPLVTMARYFKRFLKLKPDVVHCHNPAPTIHAALSARLAGVRKVLTTRHRIELPYDIPEEKKYNVVAVFCDWMTGICETSCEQLRGAPWAHQDKIVRVYNGSAPVERVGFEALGKRRFTLVFVGRLAPEKDVPTMIRAMAIAVKQNAELDCWIVGDGRVRADLEALVAELGLQNHVKFWGMRMDTAQFFSAADAFIMSSRSEGLPMSLLQAMSLGLPAVLTDTDGGAEIVRMYGTGLLAPVGDYEALAAQIVRIAADTELRQELAAKALAAYRQYFTLETMGEGYMALYQG